MIYILASQSPRRRELLTRMGINFSVISPLVDESIPEGIPAAEAVMMLARRKAMMVMEAQDQVIIAADTVVVVDGEIMGKPADHQDAYRMLFKLQGKSHQVITGICIRTQTILEVECEITVVEMDTMDEAAIWRYIETQEPMDKAGAYGIQGIGGMYINAVHGNYDSVMGLPTARLRRMLIRAGVWTQSS